MLNFPISCCLNCLVKSCTIQVFTLSNPISSWVGETSLTLGNVVNPTIRKRHQNGCGLVGLYHIRQQSHSFCCFQNLESSSSPFPPGLRKATFFEATSFGPAPVPLEKLFLDLPGRDLREIKSNRFPNGGFSTGKTQNYLGQTKVLGRFEGMEIILFTSVIIGPADRTQWSQEPNTLDRVPKELLLRRKPNEANLLGCGYAYDPTLKTSW